MTKRWAAAALAPHEPVRVVGDWLRWTLGYNRGAAMNLPFGPSPRWILVGLSVVVIAVMARMLRDTSPGDRPATLAFALVIGGALGNLVDRVVSARGVVDFIDAGIGTHRFWTFNVADAGITCGAVLLALLSLRRRPAAPAPVVPPGTGAAPSTGTPE